MNPSNMHASAAADAYEAPRIESVLDAKDVEREVHYAGDVTT